MGRDLINPTSLCLIKMGKKGLELAKAHPDNLPDEIKNQIILKAMPLGAKNGDFTTTNIGDYNFSGYVFTLPQQENRNNIASLVAVFDSEIKNPSKIRKVFDFTIKELKRNDLVNENILSNILPKLYKGFNDGYMKIRVSSIVTLEFDFKEDSNEEIEDSIASNVKKDVWK
ncbi:MAG: hypothetical protein GF308_11375 [Candidatus Heimdallarchaeota archaeon]|nr:hypothetical protein [Candidatus Heimdallarchaeota archaeon]